MGKRIPLRERWERYVVKGAGEACWEWVGPRNERGYGTVTVWMGERWLTRRAHRVAYELFVGQIPEAKLLDHTCHNRACVNPAHLRVVTNKQNEKNRAGLSRNNTSGYRGVYRINRVGRSEAWEARVGHNGKQHIAGYYATAEEANQAVIALRNRLFTHNDADRAA